MSDNSSAAEKTREAAQRLAIDQNDVDLARLRSDLSSEAGSESTASSPHFYSSSVRHDDPSLDSYTSTYTTENHRLDSSEAHDDDFPPPNSASEQQLEEQGVKLDLLRRAHSQRAKETLEQLQHAASGASSHGHESSAQSLDSNISISTDTVRQRSQQLRQASEDLKRFAVEQRTSAEDAVANYLFQEDTILNDTAGGVSEHGRNSGASTRTSLGSRKNSGASSVRESDDGKQGMQRSLSRQLEKLRRAEQAINDAEADEKVADRLIALERSISQDSAQAKATDPAPHDADKHKDSAEADHKAADHGPRRLLRDISEDSQEGQFSSSNSHHSGHMAASAFAAVSHLEHPDNDKTSNADQQPTPAAETARAAAQKAADSSILHDVRQAASIDKAEARPREIASAGTKPQKSSSAAQLPDSSTPFEPGSVATPAPTVDSPAEAQPATAAKVSRQDSQPSQAGSSPGSQTFDSALHQGISELVQAPDSAAHTSQGPLLQDAASPMYALESDEDDLAVVSSQEQAQAAQVAADEFIQSSRPTTPDGEHQQPPSGQPALEGEQGQQGADSVQQEEDVAGSTRQYLNDSLQQQPMPEPFEPEEFRGMLFHDGVDSQGRPVVVVNTDAVGTGRKARSAALQYMLHRLEPIVTQGSYVLVMVATGRHQSSNKLPAMWLISAYRSLSKPFRKNVRYIVLVRPTSGLKTLVAVIRPFVSSKAAKKVKKVDSLAGIAAATGGEVTLQHLGSRFAAASGDYILQGIASPPTSAPSYNMPSF